MKRKIFSIVFALALVLGFILATAAPAGAVVYHVHNVTQATDYTTIQAAINAAVNGDTLQVDAGTYNETLNLLGKTLTIEGAGVDTTIVDASSFTGYAVQGFGNSSTIRDLTLIGTGSGPSSYGFKVSHVNNITFDSVKVDNSYKTAFDLNTVNGAILTDIEATDTAAGFGLMIFDSNNVTVTNVATSGNAWGGVSVQTKGSASDSIAFSGNFDVQENNPLLLEKDPPTYFDITNVLIPSKFTHIVYAFRVGDNYKQWFYQETLDGAKACAGALMAGPFTYSGMTIYDIAGENYYVIEGMKIQDAVDAASGTTINVAAGTYAGAIVNKDVTISGAPGGASIINSGVPYKVGGPALTTAFRLDGGADGAEIRNFTINNNQPASFYFAIFARGVNNVTIDSLTVNDTVQGITNWGGSGWTITNNTITDTVAAGGGGIGIFLGAVPPNYRTCSNNLVQDNIINATATAADYSCPGILLSLDLRYGAYDLLNGTEDISGNQILNNDITAAGANNGVGIEVGTILGDDEEDPARTDPVKIAAIMAAAAVHDNTVQENTADGAYYGIYFYNVTDLTINQNEIENSVSDGIFAEHAQSGTVIQDNDFSNNNVQLTDDTGTLDIESILGNNLFDRAVTVDHSGASLLHTIWSNIQDGIDAAVGGDTVNVAAGTYTEALTINKSLTLRGATYNVNKNGYTVPADYAWDNTVESIIIHPTPTVAYNAVVDIVDVDNVTFEGFIVQELNAVGNLNTSLIRVYAHTREISNIIVRNNVIGPNTNATSQDGTHGRMGLYLVNHPYSDQYGIVNSTFSGNKIFDCKGNGNNVFIWSSYSNPSYGAPGPASMSGTVIEDNEIYGAHRSGIETAGGYTGLTIQNNKIYNNGGMFEADADNLKYGHGIVLIRGSGDSHLPDNPGLGPEDLTIKDNEIYGNQKSGIYMGPISKNYTITGNKIYNNGWDGMRLDLAESYNNPDFEEGDRIPWADQTENITAHFNNIYGNDGHGIRVIGEPTNGFVLDAENNWWGAKSGPYHLDTNAEGLGDAVSDNVDYEPWTGASVEDTTTEDITDGTLDAIDEADTEVIVDGSATVTVAEYTDNPGGGFGGGTGKYIDVNIDDAAGVTGIEIRLYYTDAEIGGLVESSLSLRWWNGTDWVECSGPLPGDTGVNTTDIPGPPAYSGYMWAKIRAAADPNPTIPTLGDLTGTPFGGGGSGGGGGGGGGAGTILPTVTGLVVIPPLELDPDGVIQATCHLKTTDGKLTLDITKGTKLLDPAGKPLKILSAMRELLPPSAPPGAVIIIAYNFGLSGATFSPAITLTISYDPATLPDDVAEEDLYIAYWDGSKWVALETTVDTMTRAASGSIGHYTIFALIGSVTPPAPAAFSASNLTINPLEVQPNDVVNITLAVANTGEIEGSYSVVLKINGAKEAEKSITLAPGKSQNVSFSVTRAEAGSYNVTVEGLSGSFTVAAVSLGGPAPEAKPPINWMWIGIIAAVVIIVGLVIFFSTRRRAY